MNTHFKPMLAASCDKFDDLRYPVWASPKFDGIRCLTADLPSGHDFCAPLCRSLKPVPNDYIRSILSDFPPGLDGELVTFTWGKLDAFNVTQSKVMNHAGRPVFKLMAFDYNIFGDNKGIRNTPIPYCERVNMLSKIDMDAPGDEFFSAVRPVICNDPQELTEYAAKCIADGYEGVCFRHPLGPYKYGRSTLREQWLVKYKQFQDSEAICVGVEELYSNQNEPTKNRMGYQERSSHQAGMVPMGTLGALVLRCEAGDFRVGTGFSAQDRDCLWAQRESLIGRVIRFRHQPHGAKELPRIPVFIGIRNVLDMDYVNIKAKQQELL